jgi:hypothetical protein
MMMPFSNKLSGSCQSLFPDGVSDGFFVLTPAALVTIYLQAKSVFCHKYQGHTMLTKALIDHLRQKVGSGNVYHEREDLLVYGYDATPEIRGIPDVAVFPENIDGLKAALAFSRDEGLPVTPRGAATGLSGGSTPIDGGMVLGLTRMNRIIEIDEENLTATAEAGVITIDLFNAVAVRGLFYPPDPGSQNVSTLGGNVAENAGGLRGLKYGVTRNYVMALNGLLYDGTEFTTGGKCVKDVAGYSLRDLLVGSEGTLGIITEITVRLITPPQEKRTLLAYFRDIRTAGEAVSKIIAARIIPATLEIMDKMTTTASRTTPPSDSPGRWRPSSSSRSTATPQLSPRRPKGSGGSLKRFGRMRFIRPRTPQRPPGLPPPGGPRFRLWPASRRPRSSKTPPSPGAAWPRPSPRSNGSRRNTGSG